jgi:D-aminoacyl-tRNA deacylase
MRAVIQRAGRASVSVDGRVIGSIGRGLVVLVCVAEGDDDDDAVALSAKIAHLRIFRDHEDRMNLSILDIGGSVLVISQFTLCADVRKGNRPSFNRAAAPERGAHLIEVVTSELESYGIGTATGEFGARMTVSLDNDGPVTVVLDVESGRVF